MSAVLIYCDGSPIMGFGHFRRSLSLFQYLKKQGVTCYIDCLSEQGKTYFPCNEVNDISSFDKSSESKNITVVVFDVPYVLNEQVKAEKKKGRKILCLDCLSLLNVDLSLFIFKHPAQDIKGKHFIGYQYVIIRGAFLQLENFPVTNHTKVLITLGGGDVKQQSIIVAHQLLKLGYKVDLILGPLVKYEVRITHKNLTIHCTPDNFPQLMNNANWCIVNGGGCLFEALFLKKPCFVLPQTVAEKAIATDLFDKMQLLGVGIENLTHFSIDKLRQCQQSINLIDGYGLEKISQHVKEMMVETTHDE